MCWQRTPIVFFTYRAEPAHHGPNVVLLALTHLDQRFIEIGLGDHTKAIYT